MVRGDRQFKITERVGDDAYNLQLPTDMVVSATFSIEDFSSYVEDFLEDPSDLRPNPPKEGGLM